MRRLKIESTDVNIERESQNAYVECDSGSESIKNKKNENGLMEDKSLANDAESQDSINDKVITRFRCTKDFKDYYLLVKAHSDPTVNVPLYRKRIMFTPCAIMSLKSRPKKLLNMDCMSGTKSYQVIDSVPWKNTNFLQKRKQRQGASKTLNTVKMTAEKGKTGKAVLFPNDSNQRDTNIVGEVATPIFEFSMTKDTQKSVGERNSYSDQVTDTNDSQHTYIGTNAMASIKNDCSVDASTGDLNGPTKKRFIGDCLPLGISEEPVPVTDCDKASTAIADNKINMKDKPKSMVRTDMTRHNRQWNRRTKKYVRDGNGVAHDIGKFHKGQDDATSQCSTPVGQQIAIMTCQSIYPDDCNNNEEFWVYSETQNRSLGDNGYCEMEDDVESMHGMEGGRGGTVRKREPLLSGRRVLNWVKSLNLNSKNDAYHSERLRIANMPHSVRKVVYL